MMNFKGITHIIDAINAGLKAGGDNEDWDAPEFQVVRDLTEEAGCAWDFSSWSDTLATIENHGQLGGVRL
jgi:hypothetical protein